MNTVFFCFSFALSLSLSYSSFQSTLYFSCFSSIVEKKIQNTHRLEHVKYLFWSASRLIYIKKNTNKDKSETRDSYFSPFLPPFFVARVTRGEGGGLGLALLFFLLEGVAGGVGVTTSSICTPVSSPVSTFLRWHCTLRCILLTMHLTQMVMINKMIITTAVTARLYASCTVKIKKILLSVLFNQREREIQCLCSNLFFNHALQIQTTHVLRKIIYKNNNQHAPMLMQKNELVTCITNW